MPPSTAYPDWRRRHPARPGANAIDADDIRAVQQDGAHPVQPGRGRAGKDFAQHDGPGNTGIDSFCLVLNGYRQPILSRQLAFRSVCQMRGYIIEVPPDDVGSLLL